MNLSGIDKSVDYRLEIQMIKARSVEDIEGFVLYILGKIPDSKNLAEQVLRLVEKKVLNIGSMKDEDLLFAALLAIILSDIQCNIYADSRKIDTKKIRAICENRGIDYRFIEQITVFWEKFLDLFFPI